MDKYNELLESITTEELSEMLQDCISYDGSFDDLDYQSNDEEFFECYFQDKMEVARAICYGDYNYMDDYVRFNAYGNLESLSEYDLEEELQDNVDEIVDLLEEYKDHLDLYSEELKELIKEE